MKNKNTLFFVLFSMTFFTSCRLGKEYNRAANLAPDSFRLAAAESETIADLPWWELYQDPTLVALIDSALSNNLDLLTAASRIRQAEAQIGVVRANLRPRVNYGAAGDLNASTLSNSSSLSGGIPISYQIDLWGQLRNLRDAAIYNYLANEEGYRALTITLVSSVAEAYFLLRDLDNRLIISESTAASWQANFEIIKARNDAGLVSEVAVNQALIQVEEAKANIQTFRRLRVQTENALSTILGVPPLDIPRGAPLQEQVLPPALPVGLPSYLLDRRPDILAVEKQLQAQNYRIGATEALRYPSLTLSADLGASFLNPAAAFASLGTQIFGPIFNSGENKRRIEIEKEIAEQLFLSYQSTFINALREVEDALIAIETFELELASRRKQVESAEQALELAYVRYNNGVTSYLEILDLQRTTFNTSLRASEIMQQRLTSTVDLYRALGGGWLYESDSIPK
ncbi:efflux transporter outer membrane subunit [Algoriphagus namhaensis]